MANEVLFPQGNDATLSLEINDSAGADLDLTGSTVTFEVTDSSGNVQFTKTGTITNPPGTDGLATVDIAAADTSALSGIYAYSIKVTDGSSNVSTVRVSAFYVITVQNQIDKETVRTLLGDTDSTDYILTEAQIYFFLLTSDGVYSAAARGARAIQSKFSRLADTVIEDVSVYYSQLAKNYGDLTEDLKRQAEEESSEIVSPEITGISISAMDTVEEDGDRVDSLFKIGQFNYYPFSDDTTDDREVS